MADANQSINKKKLKSYVNSGITTSIFLKKFALEIYWLEKNYIQLKIHRFSLQSDTILCKYIQNKTL